MSVVERISTKLKEIPLGTPFTPSEFISLGSRTNVGKVLERLANAGTIKRVRRGIYICPKINPHVGEVPPSVYEVMKVITASTGEVLQVQGAEAAKILGLSTQAPVREIFLTSGRSRNIMIGKIEIKLKHVSPKKLVLAGTQAGLAITALWYLGKEQVTSKTIAKIKDRISIDEFNILLNNITLMPSWMASLFTYYEPTTIKTSLVILDEQTEQKYKSKFVSPIVNSYNFNTEKNHNEQSKKRSGKVP